MPSVNDILVTFLRAVTGIEGLSLNDQLSRLANLNYVIPPRTATDPVDPPAGAVWTNTTVGKQRRFQNGQVEDIDGTPVP